MKDLIGTIIKLGVALIVALLFIETCVGPVKVGLIEREVKPYEATFQDIELKKDIEDFQLKFKDFFFDNEDFKPYSLNKKFDPFTGVTTLEIDFLRDVSEISRYEELIDEIENLNKDDQIVLKFSNFGGSVYTGAALFNVFTQSPAKIHAIIEAPSFSMGAMLPCVADTIDLKPFSFLMYHDYSGGVQGKGSEMVRQLQAFDTIVLKMLNECVKNDIITEEQKIDIKNGQDVYIHPEDIR